MAFTGPGYPNWLIGEYPGLEGIDTGLGAYSQLMRNPGYKQLTASSASDPSASQYQRATAGGAPLGAGAGLFAQLLSGQFGADVQGQAAQQQGQANAAQGRVQGGQAAGNLMAGQQEANLGLEKAQNEKSLQELGGFGGILNAVTNPKGLGANIMHAFVPSTDGQSPLGSGLGLLGTLFSGNGMPSLEDILPELGGSEGPEGIASLFADLAPAVAGA